MKKPGIKRTIGEPVFISKTELGLHLRLCNLQSSLDRWIAAGSFPPPHSRPGGMRHAVWLRAHWNAYVATGAWPAEAWPTRRR